LPWNHLHKPSPTKVSTELDSPRPPLPFPLSPAAADPRGTGNHRRRPGRPHGPTPSPTSVRFEGDEGGFLANTPLSLSFLYQNTPPLYSPLYFFQIKP
jgi:hypothetical protein